MIKAVSQQHYGLTAGMVSYPAEVRDHALNSRGIPVAERCQAAWGAFCESPISTPLENAVRDMEGPEVLTSAWTGVEVSLINVQQFGMTLLEPPAGAPLTHESATKLATLVALHVDALNTLEEIISHMTDELVRREAAYLATMAQSAATMKTSFDYAETRLRQRGADIGAGSWQAPAETERLQVIRQKAEHWISDSEELAEVRDLLGLTYQARLSAMVASDLAMTLEAALIHAVASESL